MRKKQVDKSHYNFKKYFTKERLLSIWHQLDEIIKLNPNSVLEIGPDNGIFKEMAKTFGIDVDTLDIDSELNPDFLAPADNMPFDENTYDVVCAFQMLEHVPFDLSLKIFQEMCRVSSKYIIISLPNDLTAWPMSITIPRIGKLNFYIVKPTFQLREQVFNGEHYWELNRKGYKTNDVVKSLLEQFSSLQLIDTYRVKENPYHQFFIFQKDL
jgi:SAM-dependent methyltransferase